MYEYGACQCVHCPLGKGNCKQYEKNKRDKNLEICAKCTCPKFIHEQIVDDAVGTQLDAEITQHAIATTSAETILKLATKVAPKGVAIATSKPPVVAKATKAAAKSAKTAPKTAPPPPPVINNDVREFFVAPAPEKACSKRKLTDDEEKPKKSKKGAAIAMQNFTMFDTDGKSQSVALNRLSSVSKQLFIIDSPQVSIPSTTTASLSGSSSLSSPSQSIEKINSLVMELVDNNIVLTCIFVCQSDNIGLTLCRVGFSNFCVTIIRIFYQLLISKTARSACGAPTTMPINVVGSLALRDPLLDISAPTLASVYQTTLHCKKRYVQI